ncbi:ATP-grasp domain-containing protein [Francisella hispaniensis]|uniref:Uperin family protein n=1 Tax=Francisella hispaniensis FSC454 TaxID=1088883 RepID=A0AAC9NPI4_9GAMM|nr:ATP-grasp domain-containing protein [Francisella hispaniensis]APD50112.1 uperin family protein [Francisella hispaniensis FSC454]KYW87455.1 uperin family protein [Francisella hispaniensis FSC454]
MFKTTTKRVLIVNPGPSAEYTITELFKNDVEIFIIITLDPIVILKLIEKVIIKIKNIIIASEDNFDISYLESLNFDYIICGQEESILIFDRLMNKLLPQYANSLNTSLVRKDKYLTHEVLRAKGLNYINQKQISYEDYTEVDMDYPCFIKPLDGSASIGAQRLNSDFDKENYMKQRLVSPMARVYDKFIISELIQGKEYFVDAFSVNGKHYISSIQKYDKIIFKGTPIPISSELEKDQVILDIITQYIKPVLSALGLENGFSHSELFLTADNKPVLIELNPRVSGATGAANITAAFTGNKTQLDIFAEKILARNIPQRQAMFAKTLCLYNFTNNPLIDLNTLKSTFSSIKVVNQLKPVGYVRNNDSNLSILDIVAFMVLQNDNFEELEKDAQQILRYDIETGYTSI